MILDLLVFAIILSVLVLVHEFGHFITAKKFGIKVEEFGFGFPPKIFSKKIGETTYSINLLPIGGFVKLYGEDDAGGGSIKRKKTEPIGDLKRAFFARPAWQRAVIVLAGVVMNLLLAIVIISYLFSVPGIVTPKGYALVEKTVPNSPAAKINLKEGDRVISLNGFKIRTVRELRDVLSKNKEKKGKLVIERSGKELAFDVAPEKKLEDGKEIYLLGVQLNDSDLKKYPWYQAPFYGTIEVVKYSWLILTGLGGIVGDLATKGQVPKDAAGPVGIFQLVKEALQHGLVPVLWIAAVLSLNLAVINVLPIPALDGGRLFFILTELVTGKKVSPKFEAMAHAIGLALLLALILFITFFDIARVLSGQSLLPKM